MDEDDVASALINPVYAISIDPDLKGLHEPIVSKEQWIATNRRLAAELGVEEWLRQLLAVLEGDFLDNPGDPKAPFGYRRGA